MEKDSFMDRHKMNIATKYQHGAKNFQLPDSRSIVQKAQELSPLKRIFTI